MKQLLIGTHVLHINVDTNCIPPLAMWICMYIMTLDTNYILLLDYIHA